MALHNLFNTSLVAAEDLDDAQYHAVAVVDGKLANNTAEATGILENKPLDGEYMTVNYNGEFRYAAGGAITKGDKLVVATSGWFKSGGDYDTSIGTAKADITSGSIGIGFFAFQNAQDQQEAFTYGVTPAGAVLAGIAYALDDNNVAATGEDTDGVAVGALTSAVAGTIALMGIAPVKVADTTSAGDPLTVTGSGYWSIATSADYVVGKMLTNTASGINGDALVMTVNAGYWGA